MGAGHWHDFQYRTGRAYWLALLKHCKGNVSAAARVAGVNRTDAYKVLARHGITFLSHEGRWEKPVPGIFDWVDGHPPDFDALYPDQQKRHG